MASENRNDGEVKGIGNPSIAVSEIGYGCESALEKVNATP